MNRLTRTLLFVSLFAAPAATAAAQTRARGPQSAPAALKPAAKPQTQTPATPAARPAPSPAAKSAADECGCEGRPLPAVLAVVVGVKLTPADLSPQVREEVERLQRQVVEARRNELKLQINTLLLEAEAKKRGVTTARLLEDEVAAKTINPTEAEAQNYFEQNRARIEAQAGRAVEFAEVRQSVINFLLGERRQDRAELFAAALHASADVKVLVPEPKPPANEAERARLLATVNGRPVTSGDVEKALLPLVAAVQEQVHALRARDLDLQINDLLLTREAQKRQLTPRALLDAEVGSKKTVVTEAEAQKFYDQNKARINGDFAQVKYQIIQFLEEEQERKLSDELAARLRAAAGVQTFLVAPEPPAYEIAADDQPSKGAQSAAVTVVKFTDYQCPSCAAAHPFLERLAAEMGDRVRFVIRDFPLEQHADAFKAAEAAEAAREQGKYWDYVAVLYRNQSALGVEKLKQYASVLGLDRARFDAALDSGKFSERVRRDLEDGRRIGVSGTPTFFVNGRRVREASYETVKAAVEAALKAPARK
jgi:protein-disulfide isomerase